jgi:hypothetical protein
VIPIEHGEQCAQHDHADGQPQDPGRNVVDLIEAAIALISKSHDVSPFLPFDGTYNDSTQIYHQANAFPGPGKGALGVMAKCCRFVSSQLATSKRAAPAPIAPAV